MQQYHELLRHVLKNGVSHDDRTGVGTLSCFGAQMRFNLREGFPLVTTKYVPFRWVAEELFWFLSGSTNERDLSDKGVDIWKEWADEEHASRFHRKEGDLGPIYGYQWSSFGGDYLERDGIDQIARLLRDIKKNPNSRRLIVTAWNPEDVDQVDLPPCHTLFQFKVENNKTLHCHLYQRSADLFLGVPFNIASYALLTHMIAHVTGLEVGDFIHSFGDVHIYKNHLAQVDELLSREPRPLPWIDFRHLHEVGRRDSITIFELLNMSWDSFILREYDHHGKISAPVAV